MADVKDLNYYKSNCAEICWNTYKVLRYINELEDTVESYFKLVPIKQSEELFCVNHPYENTYISITGAIVCVECLHTLLKKKRYGKR
jgi:hypothetical protein